MNKKIKIINGKVLLPEELKSVDIIIENGVIEKIGKDTGNADLYRVVDAEGKYILPGFVDVHTNGIAGFDLTNGVYDLKNGNFISDEETYLQGLDNALKEYAKTGVTRAVLTSLASPIEQLKQVFQYVEKYKNDHIQSPWKEVLGGLFVEGTFMKLIDYRGAHNPDYFNEPSIELFNDLQTSAGGLIKVVNVVPEWGDSAFELISYLSKKNIVCAAGHTGAIGFQYDKAIKNGLSLAVHFLNGPTGSSSKSLDGGGAVENVLRSNGMFVEIIVDGYHVDKSYVMDTIKRKGFDKVIAITDSMFAAAFKNLKEFHVLGVDGVVSPNGEYLQIVDREYALFGSMLTMDSAFSNVLTWLTMPIEGVWHSMHNPLSFEEALIKTSYLCSRNPAKILGIYEPQGSATGLPVDNFTGSLETGKSADIIIAEINKMSSGYELNIDKVFVKGYQL